MSIRSVLRPTAPGLRPGGRHPLVVLGGLGVAVVVVAVAWPEPRTDRPDAPAAAIEAGQRCRGLAPAGTPVSCGTTAFGDLRYLCPYGASGDCRSTREVTVENTGDAAVFVSVVSGSAPGGRHESGRHLLEETDTVVLAPRARDRYLYDIVLTTTTEGPTDVTVVDAR